MPINDFAAFAGEALEGLFGISFRNIFGIGGFNLVAEFLLYGFKALVVLVSPAEVTDRANIDPAGFQGFGGAEAEAAPSIMAAAAAVIKNFFIEQSLFIFLVFVVNDPARKAVPGRPAYCDASKPCSRR